MPRDAALPTTSYAILGLLTLGGRSGYELAQAIEASIAHFWPISKSQVYAELSRLEELGYVRGTAVEQEKLPDKRTFEPTADGEAALDVWLAEPGWAESRVRHGLLVKLFFGNRMPPERLREHLERYRTETETFREQITRIVEGLDGHPELVYMRATALLGLRSAEAQLAWLDDVDALLEDRKARKGER